LNIKIPGHTYWALSGGAQKFVNDVESTAPSSQHTSSCPFVPNNTLRGWDEMDVADSKSTRLQSLGTITNEEQVNRTQKNLNEVFVLMI